jgi:hypothetical protein
VIARLLLVTAGLLWAGQAAAASFSMESRTSEGRRTSTIRMTGLIEAGDSGRLREILTDARRTPTAGGAPHHIVGELSSLGGDVYEGLKIGYLFREFTVATLVRQGDSCLSACALAFLGGTEAILPKAIPDRAIEIGGEVGFHSFWLNPAGAGERPCDSAAGSMIMGFNIARGGAALLIKYANVMNIDMGFIGRLLGRPPEEWEYIDFAGEFMDLASCPLPLKAPAADPAQIAINICNNVLGVAEGEASPRARPMDALEARRHLLGHIQERVALYGIKGPFAKQLATVLASRDDRMLEQTYADFRSAGMPLPDITGPAYEVTGYRAGAAEVQCHVSFSLKDPDRVEVALVSEAGMTGARRDGPPQCRRLLEFDRTAMLNPQRQ